MLARDIIERLTYSNFQSLMGIASPFLAGLGALLATMSSTIKEYLTSTLTPPPVTQVLVLETAFANSVYMVPQFGFATT
jgi:hypothetical protein